MSTQTMSRILLSVFLSPILVIAIYWLTSGVVIWGSLVLIGAVLLYVWIWRVHKPVEKQL